MDSALSSCGSCADHVHLYVYNNNRINSCLSNDLVETAQQPTALFPRTRRLKVLLSCVVYLGLAIKQLPLNQYLNIECGSKRSRRLLLSLVGTSKRLRIKSGALLAKNNRMTCLTTTATT